MDTTGSGAHDALTAVERRRLADAIRGPLDRFDVAGATLFERLTAGGVSPSVAGLLVAAFARESGPSQLRLFSEGGEV